MDTNLTELINGAADGDQRCMHELILKVQPRIRAHIMRCTLKEDLAEDMLQETMMQMMTSLPSLENHERFWPWVYRIASNKIASHFRKAKRRETVSFSSLEEHILDSMLKDETTDVSDKPLLKELGGIVMKAVSKLNSHQRAILSLRCFEDMPYSEIGQTVGCSESAARVHFLRARKKLKSNLKAQGITGKAVLLALVLFGKYTAGEAMAAGITTGSVVFETGMTTAEVILLTLKSKIVKIGSAAAILLLGIFIFSQLGSDALPARDLVNSVHFIVQGLDVRNNPASSLSRSDITGNNSGQYYVKGIYEKWVQYPQGADGPIQVRMQRWTLNEKKKLCAWLQDEEAYYYYDSVGNKIHLTNDPIGMLILPTDPPEMVDFILQHDGYYRNTQYHHDPKTGLCRQSTDNRIPGKDYPTQYEYNTSSEADFEPFWPHDAKVIDRRDLMHKRGWTYFTFSGTIGDVNISGKGQMPLRYSVYEYYQPWLKMNIGDTLEVIDTPDGAVMKHLGSGTIERYPAGTFFEGLGRPWSGIRAFDTLCRDAARNRIPFATARKGEAGKVTLEKKSAYSSLQLEYHIDMDKDLIESIYLSRFGDGANEGKLFFRYAQRLEDWPEVYEMPELPQTATTTDTQEIRYWPVWLLEHIHDADRLVLR